MTQPFTWQNERWPLSRLLPADYNPRQLTKKQSIELKKSLERFGVVDPIIANLDGRIIGGHQRIRLLADLGVQEVDVRVPSRQLIESEEKELNLRLNGNSGEFDFAMLANNFDEAMLADTGLDWLLPVNLGEKEDKPKKSDDVKRVATCPSCGQCFDV